MNLPIAISLPVSRIHPASERLNTIVEIIAKSAWTLLVCKLVIGMVSAYDVYLTIKYVESLPSMEINPIGRWLMMLDCGPECQLSQTACFIASKFAGNFLVLAILELVASWRKPLASLVAVAVAAFQLGLFYFLLFGTNQGATSLPAM